MFTKNILLRQITFLKTLINFSFLEFLLGDVLVAPVLEQGATSRNIYFPQGIWQDETIKDAAPIIGPTWVNNYPASLEVLPYFTRKTTSSSSMLSPSLFVILVASLFFIYK